MAIAPAVLCGHMHHSTWIIPDITWSCRWEERTMIPFSSWRIPLTIAHNFLRVTCSDIRFKYSICLTLGVVNYTISPQELLCSLSKSKSDSKRAGNYISGLKRMQSSGIGKGGNTLFNTTALAVLSLWRRKDRSNLEWHWEAELTTHTKFQLYRKIKNEIIQ